MTVENFRGIRIDYLKFATYWSADQAQLYYDQIHKVANESAYPAEYVMRHIRFTVLPSNKGRAVPLRIVEISGPMCELYYNLPLHWSRHLVRMDTKEYTAFLPGKDMIPLAMSILNSGPRYQCNLKSGGRENNSKDALPGYVGLRIGSMKADLYVVIYQRRGEPYAIEVRMSDDMLRRGVSQVRDVLASAGPIEPERYWSTLRDQVHRKGIERVTSVLQDIGETTADTFATIGPRRRLVHRSTGEVVGYLDGANKPCYNVGG
jgi:hypothetical protein